MTELLFIVSDSLNTVTEAAAVDEWGLLSEDLLEKEVSDLLLSIGTATLGLTDDELNMFDCVFSGKIENLLNEVISSEL
jgi:hypothetical protein